MATMTIEYNEKDKYARQVLRGLIGSGMSGPEIALHKRRKNGKDEKNTAEASDV